MGTGDKGVSMLHKVIETLKREKETLTRENKNL